MKYDYPIQVPIMVVSDEQLASVYAVLAASMGATFNIPGAPAVFPTDEAPTSPNRPVSDEHKHEPPSGEIEVDSAGVPFDPERHTGTKLKSGLWRMKKGFERPEDEAEPEEGDAGAAAAQTESPPEPSPSAPVAGEAGAPDAGTSSSEDDEFAAFREAAAQTEDTPAPAAAAREWSDADLGKLCNQAAMKLGGPEKVKEAIGEFMPEGVVPHSRHIPADRREEFAQRVEALADIEFAG